MKIPFAQAIHEARLASHLPKEADAWVIVALVKHENECQRAVDVSINLDSLDPVDVLLLAAEGLQNFAQKESRKRLRPQ